VSVESSVRTHPFTAGLPDALIERLAAMARVEQRPAGAWIARQGEPADMFHLVVDGRAAIEVSTPGRDPIIISTVHGGEVVGWSWLFPPHRWHFDVVALDDLTSLAVDGRALRAACAADHELGYEVTRRLAAVVSARLEGTRIQLLDLYSHVR
jgi:CRP/FNR family transcriptional regulator, cyclic AMP receptor protein